MVIDRTAISSRGRYKNDNIYGLYISISFVNLLSSLFIHYSFYGGNAINLTLLSLLSWNKHSPVPCEIVQINIIVVFCFFATYHALRGRYCKINMIIAFKVEISHIAFPYTINYYIFYSFCKLKYVLIDFVIKVSSLVK